MDNLPDDVCRKCLGYGMLDTFWRDKRGGRVTGGGEIACHDCGGSGKRPTAMNQANLTPYQR